MIGQLLEETLKNISNALWLWEANNKGRPMYTEEGFAGATKVFMSAMLDKMWELQERENMPQEAREQMAQELGQKIKELVKVYTDIDTTKLW